MKVYNITGEDRAIKFIDSLMNKAYEQAKRIEVRKEMDWNIQDFRYEITVEEQ